MATEARFTIKRTIIQCGAVVSIKYTYGTIDELNFFHDCQSTNAQGIIVELQEEAQRLHSDKHETYVYEVVANEEPFLAAEAKGILV